MEIEISCPHCDGKGEVDVIDQSRVNSRTIDIPYKKEICDFCSGTGLITVEEEDCAE